MPDRTVYLNASVYDEGLGQFIRSAVAFSVLLLKPIVVEEIPPPGLTQSLVAAINFATDITEGFSQKAYVGSSEFLLQPGFAVRDGTYMINTNTTGNLAVFTHVAFPIAMFAVGHVILDMVGGAIREKGPVTEYLTTVFCHHAHRFGTDFDFNLDKKNYFPNCKGISTFYVEPVDQLYSKNMTYCGVVQQFWGTVFMEENDTKLADDIIDVATKEIHLKFPKLPVEIEVDVDVNKNITTETGLTIFAQTSERNYYGTSVFLDKDVSPLTTIKNLTEKFASYMKLRAFVDEHAQDQIILFMVLSEGVSELLIGPLTKQSLAVIDVARIMAKCYITYSTTPQGMTRLIVHGIHYKNRFTKSAEEL